MADIRWLGGRIVATSGLALVFGLLALATPKQPPESLQRRAPGDESHG